MYKVTRLLTEVEYFDSFTELKEYYRPTETDSLEIHIEYAEIQDITDFEMFNTKFSDYLNIDKIEVLED